MFVRARTPVLLISRLKSSDLVASPSRNLVASPSTKRSRWSRRCQSPCQLLLCSIKGEDLRTAGEKRKNFGPLHFCANGLHSWASFRRSDRLRSPQQTQTSGAAVAELALALGGNISCQQRSWFPLRQRSAAPRSAAMRLHVDVEAGLRTWLPGQRSQIEAKRGRIPACARSY